MSSIDTCTEYAVDRHPARPQNWSFLAASNDESVLQNSLLRSPDVAAARQVIVERGHHCAGAAYNCGMAKATGEILLFVHQDLFLPAGWSKSFSSALDWLDEHDPNWGVLGLFGIGLTGSGIGHIHSTGLQRTLGAPFSSPTEVGTLDEVMLVLRRSSGLSFDDHLPGFHLYGTDICLQARQRNMRNYAVSAFCIHNSNGIRWLPLPFWRAFLYLRRKWFHALPVLAPCTSITRSRWTISRYLLLQAKACLVGSSRPGKRSECPSELYEQLVAMNPSHGRPTSGH